MNRLATSVLLAVVLAGCPKNTARPNLKLNGPTGVAIYRGYAGSAPKAQGSLGHFLAVSNTRGDDLRIIDAINDKAELAPTVVAALSVPTEPRPTLIAAGSLGDLDTTKSPPSPMPDLLVVAPAGLIPSLVSAGQFVAAIQQVVTWEDLTHVLPPIELGGVTPGAALISLVVTPGIAAGQPAPGLARVVAGMSDGSLVTIEATRDAGKESITLGAPVRQVLGFAPLHLAVSPDGTRLYVATTDPIPGPGGVLGVAELDVTGTPGAFPIRALSARAGTTLVTAIGVTPFTGNDDTATTADLDLFDPVVPRVFAVLDTAVCGRDQAIPCGLAAIDPVSGTLAADPARELPYQLPMPIDGEAVAIASSLAQAKSTKPGFLQLVAGGVSKWVQSVAAISSTSGRIYLADLPHFSIGNDLTPLTGAGRAHAQAVAASSISDANDPVSLGIWTQDDPTVVGSPWKIVVDSSFGKGIQVTPGYVGNETWTLLHQGELPGLSIVPALARVPVAAQPPSRIVLQQETPLTVPGAGPWRRVVRVYDPRLGIQVNDIVEVSGLPASECPLGTFEMVVTALLPPSADAPGGALAVTPAANQPGSANSACLAPGDRPVTVTVIAQGYVLIGSRTGYAGRPREVTDAAVDPPFVFQYENEQTLSCPIMPDAPEVWPPSAASVAACEADVVACRATCERLVLARRARRHFYVTDRCSALEDACFSYWTKPPFNLVFPNPRGPSLSFRLAVVPQNHTSQPRRGSFLSFNTIGGYSAAVRVPYSGSSVTGNVFPGQVIFFDRSEATQLSTDALRGYAAFTENLVLDFSPSATSPAAGVIR